MMSWVRARLRAEEGTDITNHAWGRDRVTRQEIAALFADDLGDTAPQKRPDKRGAKPRRFMAGRQNQTFG
jgi:hypothetical protein